MNGERDRRLLNAKFDTFKHLSTLNLAAGVLPVALLAERCATGRVALVVWFFAASIVAALGGMEPVLAEMNREDPDEPPRSAFWPMPLRPV